jgi:hypothetical protein
MSDSNDFDFRHRSPSASDLALLATHVIICAVIIYLVAFVVERMISRLRTGEYSLN